MGWLDEQPPAKHYCQYPIKASNIGDRWQCDDCGQIWVYGGMLKTGYMAFPQWYTQQDWKLAQERKEKNRRIKNIIGWMSILMIVIVVATLIAYILA